MSYTTLLCLIASFIITGCSNVEKYGLQYTCKSYRSDFSYNAYLDGGQPGPPDEWGVPYYALDSKDTYLVLDRKRRTIRIRRDSGMITIDGEDYKDLISGNLVMLTNSRMIKMEFIDPDELTMITLDHKNKHVSTRCLQKIN